MKNKIAMIAAVVLLAVGMTGCGIGKTPEKIMTKEEMKMMNEHYKDFTQSEFDNLRGNKKFVAFFHADWCSTCKKWEKELLSTLPELPTDAVVLKVDYDKEESLKKELNVKSQSTAVFFNEKGKITNTVIDPDMNEVKTFFGSTESMEEKEESVSDTDKAESVITEGEKIAEYSAEEKASLAGQKHLLFFYADWCPTCLRWKKSIEENLSELPATTRILIADYDEETELKKEFKITTQSMAVFINEDGSFESKSDPKVEVIKAFFSN